MSMRREEFESLVRAHHAAVFRTAHRVLRSDADAADVAQQVFLDLWRRGPIDLTTDVPSEGRLRWVAGRMALNALRAARRRRHHEEETAKMNTSAPRRDSEVVDHAAVRRALDGLDPVDRATVVLRYQEGLTLAAIGQAMGCAESTVHARLRGALDGLRRRLRDLGFATGALDLESLIGPSAAPIAVPAGLQASLLTIPAAAGSLFAAKLAGAALLMLTLGGTTLAFAGGRTADPIVLGSPAVAGGEVTHEVAPQDAPRRAVDSPPAVVAAPIGSGESKPQGERYADAPRAHVAGTVTATSGEPLEGAKVIAWCRELSSKAESFEVRTTTDASGRYRLDLPVTHPEGLDFRLVLRRDDWIGAFEPQDLHLRPSDDRHGVDAAMRRWAVDVAGAWSRDFTITDGAGRGIAGPYLQVFRRQIDAQGKETLTRECGAQADAAGRVGLSGDHLGEKLLRVVPWGSPFARRELALAITANEGTPVAIALGPDVPLRARIVDARSGGALPRQQLVAWRGEDTMAVGVSDERGLVELRGLDAEPVALSGGGGVWSRFRIEDVTPGMREVELRLKRRDDPSAVGLSGGEIHGRVVDGRDGRPLAVEAHAVRSYWIAPESDATAASVLRELLTPWPYQTILDSDPPPPSPEFHVEVPRPGRYMLVLAVSDHAPAVVGPFELRDGQVVNEVEIRVESGVDLVIEVRDASGAAVADAEVWIAGIDAGADAERRDRAEALARARESGQRAPSGRGHRTDAAGRLVMHHIPAGVEMRLHVVDAFRHEAASAPFRTAIAEPEHRELLVLR